MIDTNPFRGGMLSDLDLEALVLKLASDRYIFVQQIQAVELRPQANRIPTLLDRPVSVHCSSL